MTMMTVCVLTAGHGSRMGAMGNVLNKALFPVNGKAVISHIINKFPDNTQFVIGIGYLGKQVRQYLEIAHPDRKFIFQEVDNFDKPGNGPGYSLLCCKEHLQKPFYFVSCDTLWDNTIDWSLQENWFGVSKVDISISKNYCNLKIIDQQIIDILDKEAIHDMTYQAFVGLCFINDPSIFWTALQDTKKISGEHQISNGLKALIEKTKVFGQSVAWTDVGDEKQYKKVVSRYENFDFSKQNEALFILNKKVIKFFSDEKIVENRVKKSMLNSSVFPDITDHNGQFYAYVFQTGDTLYKKNNIFIFQNLLKWLDEKLWIHKKIDSSFMQKTCLKFYRQKTYERLNQYHKKYPNTDLVTIINGEKNPSATDLLLQIPWENLANGTACFMHGDLQFDNIIFDEEKNCFKLLDWRQDFGGQIEWGDLYYDLAKLYGGIILNYDYIKLNLLTYTENDKGIFFDFAQRFQTESFLHILKNYIEKKGYDLHKVKLLVPIIYLNMAPLHHYPFDKMLYALGCQLLHQELTKQRERVCV